MSMSMMDAVKNKDFDEVSRLMDLEIDKDKFFKPLIYALKHNLDDISILLINSGCDLKQESKQDGSLLYTCIANNSNIDVVKLLIDKKFDVNEYISKDNNILLFTLSLTICSLEINKLLIDNGANIHFVDNNNNTLLHIVSRCKRYASSKLLIELGLDVNSINNEGKTPLMMALSIHPNIRVDCIHIIKLLEHFGANIHETDKRERTHLYNAVMYSSYKSVKFLIRKGVDVNKTSCTGKTPLFMASRLGKKSIVKILLKNNADVNISDCNNQTPLYCAAREGYSEIMNMLLYKHPKDVKLLALDEKLPFNSTQILNEYLSVTKKSPL